MYQKLIKLKCDLSNAKYAEIVTKTSLEEAERHELPARIISDKQKQHEMASSMVSKINMQLEKLMDANNYSEFNSLFGPVKK